MAAAAEPCSLRAAKHMASCDLSSNGLYHYLKHDAEHLGLRPVTLGQCCFAGLNESLSAFQHHSTLFFGDSTTFELAIGVELLLRFRGYKKAHVINDAANSDLFNASFDYMMQFKRRKEMRMGLFLSSDGGQTKLTFSNPQGSVGRYTGAACGILYKSLEEALQSVKPSVLVVNWGAHWYHTIGFGSFVPAACVVREWLEYEGFVHSLLLLAQVANVSHIIWRGNSRVCPGQWAFNESIAWQQRYDTNPTDVSLYAPCEKRLLGMGYGFKVDEARVYCWNATFTEHGAQILNRRARAAIAQSGLPAVHYFDDHALHRCDLSKNSMHHDEEDLFMRVRALGNLLTWINATYGSRRQQQHKAT
mmetsp:Transcript_4532/g.7606  ORF Transcript_4532/g.7606 Transcript_4532/m.7606 type:complete len:361 (-) Transcript_4532:472-1554(-)|eukprot:CAMPEP_0119338344 /NCGR_PEP_ID=MMETSP1333-20130426/95796_1 /TAXON_ID=418940 /ORGANISM="Scyphosphaera apsteinii, Strain RCC1455" /LENGTH=360 /DNA_ID=CAMNT_0007349585 /DNA_START=210 /DNA_END=1292 /DNA_ORIENTATION=+